MRALALLAALSWPAWAQEAVPLELVLLADASGSITPSEIAFQRQGYARAITSPEVVEAITGSGGVAVVYVEWAADTALVVPWTRLDTGEDAARFAERLLAPPRMAEGRNAIGRALLSGLALIENNRFDGFRRVIDFSGDSANNYSGPSIEEARRRVLEAGITINALALACRQCDAPRPGLEEAYRTRIIGGPGAFVVVAEDAARFAEAIERKLLAEILLGAAD